MANIKIIDNDYFSDLEKSKETWNKTHGSYVEVEGITSDVMDLDTSAQKNGSKKDQIVALYKQYESMMKKGEYNDKYFQLVTEIMNLREDAKSELEADAKMYQEEIEKLKKNSNDVMNQAIIEANEKELEMINNLLNGNINSFKEIINDGYSVSSITKTNSGTVVAASKDGENSRIYMFNDKNELVGSVVVDSNEKIESSDYNSSDNTITTKTSSGKIQKYNVDRINASINIAQKYDGVNSGKYYNTDGEKVVEVAKSTLGSEYVWGACSPGAYDCSGLVAYCVTGKHERIGTTYTFMEWPETSNPEPGDICVNESHTGIYIGNGQMIHAATEGVGVITGPVQSGMKYVKYPGD